jgi:hypothetical protein
MALTPEQEAKLLADSAANAAAIAALTTENAAVKTQLAEKDSAIKDLTSKHQLSSQETAILALKAKYPDVPEATLRALPEAAREEQGKALQESFGKLKSAGALKTGSEAWANLGGIGPSVEAEDAAQLAAREAGRAKAVQAGNFMDVLRIKSRDTVEFIQKNFATR